MAKSSEFIVENDSKASLTIFVEPEAHPVLLSPGEQVTVQDSYRSMPVTIRWWIDDAGSPCLSVWPGDGDAVVKKDGKNVLAWLHNLP